MSRSTEPTSYPAHRIARYAAPAFLLTTMTAVVTSTTAAIALILGLAVLAAVVVELTRAIRGDGYGHGRPPRSLADDAETRTTMLSRLAH